MISNIKTIIELIRIVLDVLKFMDGKYSEAKFTAAVSKRKKIVDQFKTADRKKKMELLNEIN